MIARFKCHSCGAINEIEFDPHDKVWNGMETLRTLDGKGNRRKCVYCHNALTIHDVKGKEEKADAIT